MAGPRWAKMLLLVSAAASAAQSCAMMVRMCQPPCSVPQELRLKRTCAIFKPRGVLSAAGRDGRHPTLTDLMLAAGVEPLRGHIGRLDIQTSGLILVSEDPLMPNVTSALLKRCTLLLSARLFTRTRAHVSFSRALLIFKVHPPSRWLSRAGLSADYGAWPTSVVLARAACHSRRSCHRAIPTLLQRRGRAGEPAAGRTRRPARWYRGTRAFKALGRSLGSRHACGSGAGAGRRRM